ncbi:MAG: hypothetical protein M3Z75_12390 [Actinomycetota bacterium]|nr:hypothetical protein [Actinomycetota bacterium]
MYSTDGSVTTVHSSAAPIAAPALRSQTPEGQASGGIRQAQHERGGHRGRDVTEGRELAGRRVQGSGLVQRDDRAGHGGQRERKHDAGRDRDPPTTTARASPV